ncbi:MAG: choice-of-anchor P family protein [Pseudonocardiales bacterium]|nr:choice-of-anchor P family protein [Actinomycetota bacterium]
MQRKTIWRTVAAVAAAGTVAAGVVLLPTNASAAPGDSQATAFGLSAQALNGTINVGPLPTRSCPPGTGGTTSTVGVTPVGVLGQTGVLTATNACDAAGNSSATGSAANVALTPAVLVPGFPAVTATLISASCTASGASASGSSTLANASIGGVPVVNATPAANTVLLNAGGVRITLNEQITSATGKFTVNALHIRIVVAGVVLANVIVGQATCGPNVPVAAVDAFSFQNLPLILGGMAIIAMIGFGLRTGTRRLRGLA